MLYYTAVLNGIIAPPLMLVILWIANDKKIMGSHVNGRLSNVLGSIITAVMAIAGLAVVASLIG